MITRNKVMVVFAILALSFGILGSTQITDQTGVSGDSLDGTQINETFTASRTFTQPNTFQTNTWDPSGPYVMCIKNLVFQKATDGGEVNKFTVAVKYSSETRTIGDEKSLSGTGNVAGVDVNWSAVRDETAKSWTFTVSIATADGQSLDGGEISIVLSMYGKMGTTATTLFATPQKDTITVPVKSSADAPKYKIGVQTNENEKVKAYAVDSIEAQKTRAEFQDPTGPGSITEAESGQMLCICVYPSDGDRVRSVKLTGSGGDISTEVRDEKLSEGITSLATQHVYFATMPAYDVTIVVDFDYHSLKIIAENGAVSQTLTKVTTSNGTYEVGNGKSYSIGALETRRVNNNYFAGDYIELTAKANAGYEFKNWSVQGATMEGNTVLIDDTDATVTANFEPILYTITSGSISNGKLVLGASTAAAGTSVSVTTNPDRGYVLESITVQTVAGSAVAFENGSFVMPASDVVVNAVFKDDGTVPTMSCTSSTSGANTILDVSIDCSKKIDSISDPRILVVAKYGDNVINVYSKPVLTDGVGTDRIVVSTLGLTSVVLELVDGIQPGADGTVDYFCYCTYTVTGSS